MQRKPFTSQIDLTRFLDTFYQESFEGLSSMEADLLALATATSSSKKLENFDSSSGVKPDNFETIDTVFRAAHSIKGSSAVFGFEDIANFTHLLETLLDQMREGRRSAGAAEVDVLLQSVDGLRELLTARNETRSPDAELIGRISSDLNSVLESSASLAPSPAKGRPEEVSASGSSAAAGYNIEFSPHVHFFRSGNDPLMFLRNLAELGNPAAQVDLSRIPPLTALEPSDCYLAWTISLTGTSATATQVRDVFEWVDTDCDLVIRNHAASEPSPVVAPVTAVESSQVPPPETATPSESTPSADAAPVRPAVREGATIRVGTDKVDAVINLVGELVITQSMLSCIGDSFDASQLPALRSGIALLARNARELQETVLKMRMLPIGFLFDRYPRLVHDLSKRLKKQVFLRITGEATEIDKAVLERLADPMVHLMRNSLDHGIELPEVRRERGKPEEGTLHLHAEHKGGNILIEISDDGAGLNTARILSKAKERGLVKPDAVLTEAEIHSLIFAPGFSTVDELTDLSGRGVGMDVVRRNIEELNGQILLASSGAGTVITIRLPLTLAILDGQLLRVGDQRYVVPLTSIVESLRVDPATQNALPGGGEVYLSRGEYLPIISLKRLLGLQGNDDTAAPRLLMVVESRGKRAALVVDELLAQQQVVIKSLEANFMRVRGIAGATILGDGSVAMILDVAEIIQLGREIGPAANLGRPMINSGIDAAKLHHAEVTQ